MDSVQAATVVFTAHNRRELVLEAVRLAKTQSVPVEIIVCDDASTDGLGEALAAAHPDVIYRRSDRSRGPCYHRNLGVGLARSEIVFPLDDDSWLVSPDTVAQTIAAFADSRLAVAAIPFQNVLVSAEVHHTAPAPGRYSLFDFVACAHAVRKSAFEEVGGYLEELFYTGEEGELAIRLIDRGHRIALVDADPIHHRQAPKRRRYIQDFYGRRNDILFYYLRAPARYVPTRIAGTLVKSIWIALRHGTFRASFNGLREAVRFIRGRRVNRSPTRVATFRAYLECKYRGPLPLDEFERMLAA